MRVYALILLATGLYAQSTLTLTAPPPAPVTRVTTAVVGTPGPVRYYYWVVSNWPIGKSAATVSSVANAPNVLTISNYVQISWTPTSGALSYDLLRTTTSSFPSSCTCALVIGTTTPNLNDTGGGLLAYTYAATKAAQADMTLDNSMFEVPRVLTNAPWNTTTFANLPLASQHKDQIYVVIDALNYSCQTGGSSDTPAVCFSDGTQWISATSIQPTLTYNNSRVISGCPFFPDQVIFNMDISQVPVSVLDTVNQVGSTHFISNMACAAGTMTVTFSDGTGGWVPGTRLYTNNTNPIDWSTDVGRASTTSDPRVTLVTVTPTQVTYSFTCPGDAYVGGGIAASGELGATRFGETPEFAVNTHTNATPTYTLSVGTHTSNAACTGAFSPYGCCTGIGTGTCTGQSVPLYSFSNTNLTDSDNVNYPICASTGVGCPIVDILDGGIPINASAGTYCGNGDAHLIGLNSNTCQLFELFCMFGTGLAGQDNLTGPPFLAAGGAWWDLRSANMRTYRISTNDTAGLSNPGAGGLPIFPLVPTGAEVFAATLANPIKHALRLTLRNTQNSFVWPATHYASRNSQSTLPPMGTLLRLRTDFDTTTCHFDTNTGLAYPPYMRAFWYTLQHYGMYVDDNGLPLITVGYDMTPAQNTDFSGWMHCLVGSVEVVNTNGIQKTSTSFLTLPFQSQPDPLPIQVALTAVVAGSPVSVNLSVDSSPCPSPCTIALSAGQPHTISAPNQIIAGVQYTFSSWSDAGGQTHTVSPTVATTFTATYTSQFALTTTANPVAGGTVSPAGTTFYNSGTVVAVDITVNPGYIFVGFSGALSGTTHPQNVTMTAPLSVTATFIQLASWAHHKTVTINHAQVTGVLVGQPVLISDPSDANLQANAKADGSDIFFLDATNGLVPLEFEKYDNTTGTLVAWVQVPVSNLSDTVLTMYYGNPSATSLANPTGVWDNNFVGVYHVGNGTVLSGADSTGRFNGTIANATVNATAQIDGGATFNGTNASIKSTVNAGITGDVALTVECWANPTAVTATQQMCGYGGGGTRDSMNLYIGANGGGSISIEYGSAGERTAGGVIVGGAWRYFVGTKSPGAINTNTTLYLDGSSQAFATTDAGTPNFTSSKFSMGVRQDNQNFFAGSIDEFRVSNIVRPTAYITTTYNNTKNPGTFLTFGPQI